MNKIILSLLILSQFMVKAEENNASFKPEIIGEEINSEEFSYSNEIDVPTDPIDVSDYEKYNNKILACCNFPEIFTPLEKKQKFEMWKDYFVKQTQQIVAMSKNNIRPKMVVVYVPTESGKSYSDFYGAIPRNTGLPVLIIPKDDVVKRLKQQKDS